MAEWAQLFLGVGVFISAIMSIITFANQQRQAAVARAQTAAIAELALNTNSIKDALVKVTGESEFAKGKLAGIESINKEG